MNLKRLRLAVLLLASLAGPAGAVEDPLGPVNRAVYRFNDTLDRHLVRPVAVCYDRLLPGFAKQGVGNFFSNLDDVNVLVNDLLQLKFRHALHDGGRLLVNSTVGIGGVLDVGSSLGWHKNHEDFGQTLGYWGMGSGPYLVLPLLGASTLRDTAGKVPDMLLNPVFWLEREQARTAAYGLQTLEVRASLLAAEGLVTGDRYRFVRDAYLQRREYLVADGEVYDEFDDY